MDFAGFFWNCKDTATINVLRSDCTPSSRGSRGFYLVPQTDPLWASFHFTFAQPTWDRCSSPKEKLTLRELKCRADKSRSQWTRWQKHEFNPWGSTPLLRATSQGSKTGFSTPLANGASAQFCPAPSAILTFRVPGRRSSPPLQGVCPSPPTFMKLLHSRGLHT